MPRIRTCKTCVGFPRLVHFSGGSRPRSDPEALAGSCRVSLILLHCGVDVVARWARSYSCAPSAALFSSPRLALNPSAESQRCRCDAEDTFLIVLHHCCSVAPSPPRALPLPLFPPLSSSATIIGGDWTHGYDVFASFCL